MEGIIKGTAMLDITAVLAAVFTVGSVVAIYALLISERAQ